MGTAVGAAATAAAGTVAGTAAAAAAVEAPARSLLNAARSLVARSLVARLLVARLLADSWLIEARGRPKVEMRRMAGRQLRRRQTVEAPADC